MSWMKKQDPDYLLDEIRDFIEQAAVNENDAVEDITFFSKKEVMDATHNVESVRTAYENVIKERDSLIEEKESIDKDLVYVTGQYDQCYIELSYSTKDNERLQIENDNLQNIVSELHSKLFDLENPQS